MRQGSPKFITSFMPYNLYLEEEEDIDTLVSNVTNFNYWCATCKFCSNGTPILKLAVHSFWFSGTRFLLKTVRFSFIIVM